MKTYVGEYEFAPEENLKITFENGSLWGQPPGSAKRQMFAESETKFFVKTSPTEVTFQQDEKGDRKKVFEIRTSTKSLVFPFSKAEPTPNDRRSDHRDVRRS